MVVAQLPGFPFGDADLGWKLGGGGAAGGGGKIGGAGGCGTGVVGNTGAVVGAMLILVGGATILVGGGGMSIFLGGGGGGGSFFTSSLMSIVVTFSITFLAAEKARTGDERVDEDDVNHSNDDKRSNAITAHLLVSVSHSDASLHYFDPSDHSQRARRTPQGCAPTQNINFTLPGDPDAP